MFVASAELAPSTSGTWYQSQLKKNQEIFKNYSNVFMEQKFYV